MASQLLYEAFRICEKSFANAQGKGFGTATIEKEIANIQSLLGNNADVTTCVDIGGNVGNYTAALLNTFPNAEVFTFEPSRTNIKKLNARFSNQPRAHLEPFAVSDKSGDATLFSNEAGSGLGSLTKRDLSHLDIEFEISETVDTIVFDSYWRAKMHERAIDILKLDIEGHELSALKGCTSALAQTRIVQFEFGGCNIDTRTYLRDFCQFFVDLDFSLYRIAPFGPMQMKRYKERDEFFGTTNFLAVNTKI